MGCRPPDFAVDHLDLLHGKNDVWLAKIVQNDIRTVSPERQARKQGHRVPLLLDG